MFAMGQSRTLAGVCQRRPLHPHKRTTVETRCGPRANSGNQDRCGFLSTRQGPEKLTKELESFLVDPGSFAFARTADIERLDCA